MSRNTRFSAECTKSELDLFVAPMTQMSIDQTNYVEINPLNSIVDQEVLDFLIPGRVLQRAAHPRKPSGSPAKMRHCGWHFTTLFLRAWKWVGKNTCGRNCGLGFRTLSYTNNVFSWISVWLCIAYICLSIGILIDTFPVQARCERPGGNEGDSGRAESCTYSTPDTLAHYSGLIPI